jgi:hypothetical protein
MVCNERIRLLDEYAAATSAYRTAFAKVRPAKEAGRSGGSSLGVESGTAKMRQGTSGPTASQNPTRLLESIHAALVNDAISRLPLYLDGRYHEGGWSLREVLMPKHDLDLVTVFETGDSFVLTLAKSSLEEAGIERFRSHVNMTVQPVPWWNLFSKRNEVVTKKKKRPSTQRPIRFGGRSDDNERFKEDRTGSDRPR